MISSNPDKKPVRSHRGNKSPRKLGNGPYVTQNVSTNVSSVKTRSALKSPAATVQTIKIDKTQ